MPLAKPVFFGKLRFYFQRRMNMRKRFFSLFFLVEDYTLECPTLGLKKKFLDLEILVSMTNKLRQIFLS